MVTAKAVLQTAQSVTWQRGEGLDTEVLSRALELQMAMSVRSCKLVP